MFDLIWAFFLFAVLVAAVAVLALWNSIRAVRIAESARRSREGGTWPF